MIPGNKVFVLRFETSINNPMHILITYYYVKYNKESHRKDSIIFYMVILLSVIKKVCRAYKEKRIYGAGLSIVHIWLASPRKKVPCLNTSACITTDLTGFADVLNLKPNLKFDFFMVSHTNVWYNVYILLIIVYRHYKLNKGW